MSESAGNGTQSAFPSCGGFKIEDSKVTRRGRTHSTMTNGPVGSVKSLRDNKGQEKWPGQQR